MQRLHAPIQPRRIHCHSFFDQAWAVSAATADSLAPTLFAVSLFPYLGFLYHFTKSGKVPRVALFGFYFLLAFVGECIGHWPTIFSV